MADDYDDIDMLIPVGQGNWTIAPGDTIPSIADATGHYWRTIWDHADNGALKEARASENLLIAGDRVATPPITAKIERRPVDFVHRFKRKGVPLRIEFVVQDQTGRVLPDKAYTLTVGKRTYRGRTDAQGGIKAFVAPSARTGRIVVTLDEPNMPDTLTYDLAIGALQPVETPAGVSARLINLGYMAEPIEASLNERTRTALTAFQRDQGIMATGSADQATLDHLKSVHRS